MTDYLVIFCTVPDAETAGKLGRGLVEAQLAACVNVIPGLRSIYRWQGKVNDDAELLLVIKTARSSFDALAAWIKQNHPYSEPEIIALPIAAGSPSYLAWIGEQCTK